MRRCFGETDGAASFADRCVISRFIISNCVARSVTIETKISSLYAHRVTVKLIYDKLIWYVAAERIAHISSTIACKLPGNP